MTQPGPVNASVPNTSERLVIAVSSRALFALESAHQIYAELGEKEYAQYQIVHENDVLEPGMAFALVKKLLALNVQDQPRRVEVVLTSRNSADTGLRVFNSIAAHRLDISRAAFTRGRAPWRYLQDFGAQLFLSANPEDVREALSFGIAAATILPNAAQVSSHAQLRIAFDGDAVIFSDESERVYQEQGLEAFNRIETNKKDQPLPGGPFRPFLAALHALQAQYSTEDSPIRTALVTARGAPAHERVIRTLRTWTVRIDEVLFLAGKDKGAFLHSFGADIFFDDQQRHCDSAREFVTTGHVSFGVKNADI